VAGGSSRAESVSHGIAAAAAGAEFVLVHDAARPFADRSLVDRVVRATREHGAAIPALAVPDTVKRVNAAGRVEATIDRGDLRLAQTPQGARTSWLVQALSEAEREGFAVTDEASALERCGHPVAIVAGEPDNFKLTVAADVARARGLAGESTMELRVGHGFDIHRFGEDRRLVLGGVYFEDEVGLLGHSDADVVLHAAMDAVLGAAGQGDIGELFPPDDPQFKDADSAELARTVTASVAGAGYSIVNLDLMLLAERPRIRPRVTEMRESIAVCFGVAADRVGLKATTLEGLGALGRKEGIACQAVALLRRSAR